MRNILKNTQFRQCKTNNFAGASFLAFIPALLFLPLAPLITIPAIIFGHLSFLKRQDTSNKIFSNTVALIGLIINYAITGLIFYLLIHAFIEARSRPDLDKHFWDFLLYYRNSFL